MSDIPLFVINLDRSVERLALAQAQFDRLGLRVKRVAAVDADSLDGATTAATFDAAANQRRYFAPLHPGEIACFLSHRKAWDAVVASGAPFGVVLEDDVVLSDRFGEVLDALAGRPVGWDVVKLYSASMHASLPVADLAEGLRLARPWVVALSGAAYCISRRGALVLLAETRTVARPVDVELQHWWEHGLEVLAADPDCRPLGDRDAPGARALARGPRP